MALMSKCNSNHVSGCPFSSPLQVLARVLYVDPSTRQVGLSLRSHLLPPGGAVLECVQSDRVGEVLQGCKVAAVHFHSGAILELPDGTQAFGHVSQTEGGME